MKNHVLHTVQYYISGEAAGEKLKLIHLGVKRSTLSLPRVINVKFPLQPHQKCDMTQYEELAFHSLLKLKDDYTTSSHYLTYTFLFKRLGECTFGTWE